jgi:hypothetical protein
MTAIALPTNAQLAPLLNPVSKRADVQALIESYAQRHIWMDVGIGLAGFIPIPGAGLASMIGAIAAQAPLIYQPMAQEISLIYGRGVQDVEGEVIKGAVMGGALDVAADIGVEFFKDIATELLTEHGLGAILAAIPIVGGAIGIGLDVIIARKMTYRVGYMVALYYENGGNWIGSRKETYETVTRLFKRHGEKNTGEKHPPIADVVRDARDVRRNQTGSVTLLAQALADGGLSKEDIRKVSVRSRPS